MKFQSKIANTALTVILDIRYPQAYLALHPAMNFARERGIGINWLPLSVSTLRAPVAEAEGDDRGVRHKRFRAQRVAREIEVYAGAQGLLIRDFYRAGDSSAFNLGWLWMRQHHEARLEDYLSEAFRAYWAIELDPAVEAEIAALIDSLDGAGDGEGEAFRSWSQSEGSALLESLADDLGAHGVFAVPSYLVGDEIFLGRQHLPMIDWILAGRTGPIPI